MIKKTQDTPDMIQYKKTVLALVFRSGMEVPDGVRFFTPPDNPFQVGMHHRTKGTKLSPHIHRIDHPLTIDVIQELLVVISGKIQVTVFATDETHVSTVVLSTGDSILLMGGGHSVEFIETTQLFELKQGPYAGSKNAKIYFQPNP